MSAAPPVARPALDNPEYYHMSAETPPPKPPRTPAVAEPGFSCGEYLYTRLERPPVPPVPPPVARGPPPTGPYDNVPAPRRRAASPPEQRRPLTEQELTLRHRQVQEERERVQAVHELEQSRLDKILHLCAEYDSRSTTTTSSTSSAPVPAPRTPGSPAPAHSRIKTNGSLPRELRLGSPGPVGSDSEEELSCGDAPYENVSLSGYPQSPRTRIRTSLQRERQESVGIYQVPPAPVRRQVYVVPPPPVPLRPQDDTNCLQFENKEYMRGLPLDASFQNDDLLFMPAPSAPGADASLEPPLEAEQMALPDAADRDRQTCRRLKEQRRMTYRQLSELRQQRLELEHQQSESIRQLEMEHALLEGELETQAAGLSPLQAQLSSRRQTLAERVSHWEYTRGQQLLEAEQLASRVVAAEVELERLEQLSEQFRGSTDEETRLLQRLKHQHELVEQERKTHEDQEFHHMEDQVGWETEKEESLRQIHELENRIACTRNEMEAVREQQRALIESIRRDAEAMEEQRREIVRQMGQEREKLRRTQRRLSGLSQSGLQEADDDPTLEEADLSSDPDELCSEYVVSRLARLHTLGKSEEDLQRIHSVTASSPMQVDDRSSHTLREIERNRHVLLAKQGTQVIEEERRQLEQLKRRVQSQVTEQWQQQRRQASGDASAPGGCETGGWEASPDVPPPINGTRTLLTADDGHTNGETRSPISDAETQQIQTQPIRDDPAQPRPISDGAPPQWATSDDPSYRRNSEKSPCRTISDAWPCQPSSGDDAVEQSVSTGNGRCQTATAPAPASDDSGGCEELPERPRPVSEVSSVFDGVEEPVRRRQLPASPKQRPLTRYMPITDQQFDLRQHVETAGHQLEMCPAVQVSRHGCRGYLQKQGGRLRGWQRRWFVFDRHKRTFMYFADKSEHKAKGGVFFQAIEEVYVDHVKPARGGSPSTTFCVKTMSRTFLLMAPSPEAMRIWVDVIMTGAEGHTAFEPT